MALSSCEILQFTIFGLLLASSVLTLNEKPVNTTNSSVIIPSEKLLNKTSEHVVVDLSKVVEGGAIDAVPKRNSSKNDTTHTGHDRTPDVSDTKTIPSMTNSSTAVPSVNKSATVVPGVHQSEIDLPPYDVPEKNDDKLSKPRKGAILDGPINVTSSNATPIKVTSNATLTTSNNKTTTNTKSSVGNASTTKMTTEKPHKPIYTEAVDEDPNSQVETGQNKEPQVPSIEYVTDKRNHKKADYIVPIVAVILSVPLVAIVISVLYKRGAEWWQHRHYRRMDFLIDGMYNN